MPTASTNIQYVGVLMASGAVKSGSPAWRMVAPRNSLSGSSPSGAAREAILTSSSGIGSPSGRSPMLSGFRRIIKDMGVTNARMITPEMKAAGRQPALSTKNPISGAMTVPPMAVPVPAMPMARPRWRRNHWLRAGMVALL